jgi:hypothetical protein
MEIIVVRLVTRSFAEGDRVCFVRAQQTEADVLAAALRLERCGMIEEADLLLEDYCGNSS